MNAGKQEANAISKLEYLHFSVAAASGRRKKSDVFGGTRSVASKFLHSAIHNPKSEIHFSTVTAVFTELAMKQLSWAA